MLLQGNCHGIDERHRCGLCPGARKNHSGAVADIKLLALVPLGRKGQRIEKLSSAGDARDCRTTAMAQTDGGHP